MHWLLKELFFSKFLNVPHELLAGMSSDDDDRSAAIRISKNESDLQYCVPSIVF